ncbi:membrane protein insertase YidC [Vacuolonema iberomarrocanum]|uniref:membrane protein insertase YidC n=1 Tax=Vacuolonema iberomarrocanum TaxID=3454632 RepID=UPI0019E6C78B|nr:membrane protein insertase YidC [filamentous cyanobacterium LEGE 07170]
MDFGVGFLSNNVMLPILDFFYGIVPSYGLAIVALTLVVRFALYPLSAKSIRSMRQMRVAQPAMKKRMEEVKERYKDDPTKQQEEMGKAYKEFGNPLAGCFPVVLQMPILFALFATLRGSPFADVPYTLNLQVVPQGTAAEIQPEAFTSKPHNIYISDGIHVPVSAILPGGTRLAVGEKTKIDFQSDTGRPLSAYEEQFPDVDIQPYWKVTKGEERVQVNEAGVIEALQPGDVTIEGKIPGLAANKGFLFIQALGRVGAVNKQTGQINWDIVGMVAFFGLSLYANQLLSGQQKGAAANPQQSAVNKMTPVLFSTMFLFFPLPAGVLMYMSIANLFQTIQTFILSREPLPENLQKIVDEEERKNGGDEDNRDALPFEPRRKKKAS